MLSSKQYEQCLIKTYIYQLLLKWFCPVLLERGPIYHDNAHSTVMAMAEHKSGPLFTKR